MKIVIDLPKEEYKRIKNDANEFLLRCGIAPYLYEVIKNGIPLPKGHGRLIDADALLKEHKHFDAYPFPSNAVDHAPTIIEEDKEEDA